MNPCRNYFVAGRTMRYHCTAHRHPHNSMAYTFPTFREAIIGDSRKALRRGELICLVV